MSTTKFSNPYKYTDSIEELQTHMHDKTVIMFTAEWCGPCKSIKPLIKAFKEGNPSINVHFINIDEFPLANSEATQNIKSVPTFRFFKNGKQVAECMGANMANFRSNVTRHFT